MAHIKSLALSVLFGASLTAAAQQNVMRVHAKDGTVTSFVVDDVDRVDFESVGGPIGTDLGGASNCFIVSQAGTYSFATTHVDGSGVDGIDHATWLWREKSGADLVSEVSYANGRITFNANGQKGNAVIAAVDKQGTIVWIWHIWCTDQPKEHLMGSTRIMDRHLGAVSANREDGRDTWGLVYQYGRNVPFYFIGDNQEFKSSEAFNQANKFTEINPEFPGMKWRTVANTREAGYSLEESMANPLTHFLHSYVKGSMGGYHWAQDDKVKEYVWGTADKRGKTNYDPCPKGYKVPFHDQLDFTGMDYEPILDKDVQFLQPIPGFMLGESWWPMNTGRHYEDGCALYGMNAEDHCDRLFLWTAYGDKYSANVLTNYSYVPLRVIVENKYTDGTLSVTNPTVGAGAFGHAVRCVKELSFGRVKKSTEATEGKQAPQFALTLANGTEVGLADIWSKQTYTLLYFNNPDCPTCVETKAAMAKSPVLQSCMKDGSLHIVSVYTDEEPEQWRRHVADYPSTWTVAYDAPQRVVSEGLFDMSKTPAIYLVDSEGRILLSDTDLTSVEALLK